MIARFTASTLHLSVLALCALVISACTESVPLDDEEFLASVREETANTPVTATSTTGSLSANAEGYPRLEVDTDHYEMGLIPHDRISQQRMKLYNRGNAPLNIRRVATNCSCTKGRVEETVIPAGGSIDLIIEVDPSLIHGFDATRLLTIESDDPASSLFPISVESHVDPEFLLAPQGRELGLIQAGSGFEKTFRIVPQIDDALDIYGVTAGAPLLADVKEVPREAWTNPERREFDLTLTVSPAAPLGNISARVTLETNLRRTRSVYYEFAGTVHRSPYTLSPTAAILGKVQPGDRRDQVYVITANDPIESINVHEHYGNAELVPTFSEDRRRAELSVVVGDQFEEVQEFRWIADLTIAGSMYDFRLGASFEAPVESE